MVKISKQKKFPFKGTFFVYYNLFILSFIKNVSIWNVIFYKIFYSIAR